MILQTKPKKTRKRNVFSFHSVPVFQVTQNLLPSAKSLQHTSFTHATSSQKTRTTKKKKKQHKKKEKEKEKKKEKKQTLFPLTNRGGKNLRFGLLFSSPTTRSPAPGAMRRVHQVFELLRSSRARGRSKETRHLSGVRSRWEGEYSLLVTGRNLSTSWLFFGGMLWFLLGSMLFLKRGLIENFH